VAIPKATGKTYTVTTADVGHSLSLRVTATKTGYQTLTKTTTAVKAGVLALHRFYSARRGAHFYTASEAERAQVAKLYTDFKYEGVVGYVLDKTSAPGTAEAVVYRFYNKQREVHFYTADVAERDKVVATMPEWKLERAVYTVYTEQVSGATAVYRFLNKNRLVHFYTTNATEQAALPKKYPEWKPEGIAYYILK
jgi:beta-lactamase superfamily II metal-dependent hydrolase